MLLILTKPFVTMPRGRRDATRLYVAVAETTIWQEREARRIAHGLPHVHWLKGLLPTMGARRCGPRVRFRQGETQSAYMDRVARAMDEEQRRGDIVLANDRLALALASKDWSEENGDHNR